MPIQAIIFDYGGVLVRMADETPRRLLAQHIRIPLDEIYEVVFASESAHRASLGLITNDQHWQTITTALKIPPEKISAWIQQFWSVDEMNTEVVEYIRTLRPRYKVGLLSNAFDDLRQVLHDRWHLDNLFDEMIISAEVGLIKPDPRIYELATQRLGVQPFEAVFVDDVRENVEGAQKVGVHAIQYRDNTQLLNELKTLLDQSQSEGR